MSRKVGCHFVDSKQVKNTAVIFADFEQAKKLKSYFTDFERIGYGCFLDILLNPVKKFS